MDKKLGPETELAEKNLFAWNDAPERTFAEVKELFEKAIAKAEAA